MKKSSFLQLFALIVAFACLTIAAQAQTIEHCDASYQRRDQRRSAIEAVVCYKGFLENRTDLQGYRRAAEGYFLSAAYALTHFTTLESGYSPQSLANEAHSISGQFISEMEARADERARASGRPLPSGAGYYWRSAFRAWKENLASDLTILFNRDPEFRADQIPWGVINGLEDMQRDARRAHERDPSYHGHGPLRLMGILHFRTPQQVDRNHMLRAIAPLRRAMQGSPNFSLNILYLARALCEYRDEYNQADVQKTQEGRRLFEAFIQGARGDVTRYGADRIFETYDDLTQAEIRIRTCRE